MTTREINFGRTDSRNLQKEDGEKGDHLKLCLIPIMAKCAIHIRIAMLNNVQLLLHFYYSILIL